MGRERREGEVRDTEIISHIRVPVDHDLELAIV